MSDFSYDIYSHSYFQLMFILLPIIYLSVLIIFLTFLNIYICRQIIYWIQYQIKLKQILKQLKSIQHYGNLALYSLYIQQLDKALIAFLNIINLSNQYLCINNAYYNLAIIFSKSQNIEIARLYYNKILANDKNNKMVLRSFNKYE